MISSEKAIQFIIDQEDGGARYYERTEEHWDWPGGASGPTCGVGYDCGYSTADQIRADWKDYVDEETLQAIIRGAGKAGNAGHIFVINNHGDITIPFDVAVRQFRDRELPKQEEMAQAALPNFDLLSGDSAGALVSLGFNRGFSGFNSPLPRFREMHQIRRLMVAGEWALIPVQISSMIRIWPHSHDMIQRRKAEAELFAGGLKDCKPLTPTIPPPLGGLIP